MGILIDSTMSSHYPRHVTINKVYRVNDTSTHSTRWANLSVFWLVTFVHSTHTISLIRLNTWLQSVERDAKDSSARSPYPANVQRIFETELKITLPRGGIEISKKKIGYSGVFHQRKHRAKSHQNDGIKNRKKKKRNLARCPRKTESGIFSLLCCVLFLGSAISILDLLMLFFRSFSCLWSSAASICASTKCAQSPWRWRFARLHVLIDESRTSSK